MSDIAPKCTYFVEVTMIPLNGVHSVLYNFEMALLSTILDLKHEIITLMRKHGTRVKYLVNGYAKHMGLAPCEVKYKNQSWIMPLDLIHLCGQYYDAYYSMTINISVSNMVIIGRHGWTKNYIYKDAESLYHASADHFQKVKVYELLDDEVVSRRCIGHALQTNYCIEHSIEWKRSGNVDD
eukprot:71649_1